MFVSVYKIVIIDKSLGTVGRLLLQGQMKMKTVSSSPQSTTSESLAVSMTQQIEMKAIGKAVEMAR